MAPLLIGAPFVLVAVLGVWMVRWQFRRADRMLKKWARENGHRILKKQRANIGDGPTGARQSSKAVKYRVTLADASGQTKRALITLGSRSSGTLSNEVGVEWLG